MLIFLKFYGDLVIFSTTDLHGLTQIFLLIRIILKEH